MSFFTTVDLDAFLAQSPWPVWTKTTYPPETELDRIRWEIDPTELPDDAITPDTTDPLPDDEPVKNDPVPEDKPSAADLARMSEEDFAAFVKESGIRTVTTEDDATTAPVETEKENSE